MSSAATPARVVRVVVVHHGDPAPTFAAIDAVLADTSSSQRRLVVVDNSGTLDPSRLPRGVLYLACPDNPGFGAAVHRGLELLAGHGPILALNHDVRVEPGFLDASVAALEAPDPTGRGGRVGAAAGPLYLDRPGGRLWYAGGRVRWLTGTVVQNRDPGAAGRERDVGFLPGAALVVAAEAWGSVGGFDPSIFLYHEDVDLSLRLRRAGWRLRFEPAMVAVHPVGAATGSGEASPFYLEELTATRLRPFRSPLHRLYLAVLHTGWVALRALRYTLRRAPGDAVRVRALLRGHRRALTSFIGHGCRPGGIQSRRED
ncbi:MAG: glycosyltransferase family 2 protein [Acidobacteria bacterium]|nr:glycosyltransferase family 2 protein [Acidobacteriota bacterium]